MPNSPLLHPLTLLFSTKNDAFSFYFLEASFCSLNRKKISSFPFSFCHYIYKRKKSNATRKKTPRSENSFQLKMKRRGEEKKKFEFSFITKPPTIFSITTLAFYFFPQSLIFSSLPVLFIFSFWCEENGKKNYEKREKISLFRASPVFSFFLVFSLVVNEIFFPLPSSTSYKTAQERRIIRNECFE